MNLTQFSLLCLGVCVVFLVLIAIIETVEENRKRAIKRVRELHEENCKLRARLGWRDFDREYVIDEMKTQLAVKELLLRQKWAGVQK